MYDAKKIMDWHVVELKVRFDTEYWDQLVADFEMDDSVGQPVDCRSFVALYLKVETALREEILHFEYFPGVLDCSMEAH